MKHGWGYGSQQRLRESNEDHFALFTIGDITLAMVCDGMGGHFGGKHASALGIKVVHDTIESADPEISLKESLREAIQRANKAIYDASRRSHELIGMGTTIAAVAIRGGKAIVAHVGDSRVYLVRGDEVAQLTRDHTMVNLFVDAELLTPEDAESHPEAHVLSRSLGVERVVEVEFQEDLDLVDGDALLVCSDGVHGVFSESEFANIAWHDPQAGVDEVLRQVEERDGADNATAVCITAGATSSAPPTAVPEVAIEPGRPRPVSASATTAPGFTGQTPPKPGRPPQIRPTPSEDDEAITVARVADPDLNAARNAQEGAQVVPPAQPTQGQKADQKTTPKKKKKKKKGFGRRAGIALVVLVFGIVGTVGVGGLLILFLLTPGQSAEETPQAVVTVEPPPEQVETPRPTEDNQTQTAQRVEANLFYAPDHAPIIPEIHRPEEHTHPTPGGTYQVVAVRASRAGKCAKSLNTVIESMNASIDYAGLYPLAWECYTIRHREKIQTAEIDTPEDFGELEVHFRGLAPEGADQMSWKWRATSGIEHRMEAFETSDPEVDLLADVMIDILGRRTLSAELARDVLLEAEVASAFADAVLYSGKDGREDGSEAKKDRAAANQAEPDPQLVATWARRVHVAARALNGPIGDLIHDHHPEVEEQIRRELAAALPNIDLDVEPAFDEEKWPEELTVPEEVYRAYVAAFRDAKQLLSEDAGLNEAEETKATASRTAKKSSTAGPRPSEPRVYRHGDEN